MTILAPAARVSFAMEKSMTSLAGAGLLREPHANVIYTNVNEGTQTAKDDLLRLSRYAAPNKHTHTHTHKVYNFYSRPLPRINDRIEAC